MFVTNYHLTTRMMRENLTTEGENFICEMIVGVCMNDYEILAVVFSSSSSIVVL